MAKNKVVDELKKLLASTQVLYLKTQNYHWNVTGPQFYAYHKAFEGMYEDLAEAVDEIAERIRILGEKAPATYGEYLKASKVKEGDSSISALEMLKDLTKDQGVMVKILADVMKAAEAEDDQVTIDLAVGRSSTHQKNEWMLKSTLEK